MKKIFKRINNKIKIIGLYLTIALSVLAITPQISSLFNQELTNDEAILLVNKLESFVNGENIEGQLDLMDDEFMLEVKYSNDRDEKVNKDQYRKMLLDAKTLGLGYEITDRSVQITRLKDGLVMVNVAYDQEVRHKTIGFGYKERMYQSMVLHSVGGEPKVLSVSSIAKKV